MPLSGSLTLRDYYILASPLELEDRIVPLAITTMKLDRHFDPSCFPLQTAALNGFAPALVMVIHTACTHDQRVPLTLDTREHTARMDARKRRDERNRY